jgi:hypothetical protein
MTEPVKLCKDCVWYKKSWFEHLTGSGDRFDTCHNPVLSENLVTGKVKGGRFCDMMRRTYGGCGVNGEYWEARK